MEQFKSFSGSITFNKGGEPLALKKLSWEKGYIMKFNEIFNVILCEPMKIHFEITAEKITMGSETVDHKWPK